MSQIRNQVRSLKLKLARGISKEWAVAVADDKEAPQVGQRVADTGNRSHTYVNLHLCARRCHKAGSLLVTRDIVLALHPWTCDLGYTNLLR